MNTIQLSASLKVAYFVGEDIGYIAHQTRISKIHCDFTKDKPKHSHEVTDVEKEQNQFDDSQKVFGVHKLFDIIVVIHLIFCKSWVDFDLLFSILL